MITKSQAIRWASIAAFIAALVLISLFFYDNRAALTARPDINVFLIALAAVVYVINNVVKGYALALLAYPLGARLKLWECTATQNLSVLANYSLPMQGGLGLKIAYLVRVHRVPMVQFLSVSITAFFVSTGIYGVLSVVAAMLDGLDYGPTFATLMATIGLGSLGLIVIPMLAPVVATRLEHLPAGIGRILDKLVFGWRSFLKDRRRFALWVANVACRAVLEAAVFILIAMALGVELTILQLAVIALIKECSMILKLTPGAFGVAEGLAVAFGAFYGTPAIDMLLVVLINRAIELCASGAVSLVYFRRISAILASADPQPDPQERAATPAT